MARLVGLWEKYVSLSPVRQKWQLDNVNPTFDIPEFNPDRLSEAHMCSVVVPLYINEIWIGESPPAGLESKTIELIEYVLADDRRGFDEACIGIDRGYADKTWHKVQNLNKVACDLFMSPRSDPVTVEFIKQIHSDLMTTIDDEAGQFRQGNVRPAGSSTVYAPFNQVESRLRTLIDFFSRKSDELALEISNGAGPGPLTGQQKTVLLATFFFSEFLLIHPFRNGNGRTARIILSHMLRHVCIVPVSLYLNNRDDYINVLEMRGTVTNEASGALAMYVFDCMRKTICDAAFLLPPQVTTKQCT
eukprot:c17373_g1_i1.p1 GENE.c17373_g1_i1~~c17373_g1_i1.p1  ORF type:complete len:303 (+),score=45.25 c17373_g1_i1:25-933(+)